MIEAIRNFIPKLKKEESLDKLFGELPKGINLLDSFVKDIGEQNVVQVITDNKNIGRMAKVKKKEGISLVGFIYNHKLVLNMKKKFTNKMELVRHGVTRFATSFLTLQMLHNLKNNLRRVMFLKTLRKKWQSTSFLCLYFGTMLFTPFKLSACHACTYVS
ncbi:hypothetical protein CR513_41955, partial [Mucuna pruriens]